MRSIQPPLSAPASTVNRNRHRRRPDLTLPLPHRDPSLAVPLPLPPTSAPSSSTTSSLLSAPPLNFSELDRMNRIGSGSGGTVYKVVHRPTGKYYALKVIYGNHEDSVRRQICREIEILRDVDNLNVVKCHDMFDHAGEIQVLLEYMDGGSLEGTHINHEPTLADLTRQILSGICYLHSKKIVHRDIKPSNLLVNSRKQVKIADFGVSRILAQTMDPCNSSVGTIAYMSPERINTDLNQGMYDGYAGDIWSLGVSILEFYMGRFPFAVGRGGDWASLMCAICMSQPPEAPATASREFRDFIACCLQRDPGRRWTASRLLRHPFVMQNNGSGGGHGNQKNGVGYPEDYVKVAVIADPQLMDKTSLHLAPKSLAMEIAQFYTDIFMRRAFLASVLPFKPDVILFLGDYFDGGPTLSDEEWQESFSRLRHIFDLDMLERTNNVQVYYIPGNHDIGYSALHSHLPKVFRRYEKVFGTRNYLFKVGEVDFIAIDAQTLDGHPQGNLTSATWNFIKNVSRDSSSAPRILLTHIPLYRPDGTSCGLYRSSEIINQRVSLYGHNQEIMYQNYITEEKTKYILDSIRPVFILSGHDHDQCTVTHISKYGPVTEQTLGTISWQQGNLYPSFMLLSARNYTFSNASSGEDAILTHLCFLPVQTHIYIWYICQFVLTLLVVLLWPTSGLHFLRHVGEFMGHIKSIICCNIFKGVTKKKSEEENCEYEMIWDAEGSMHLIKRTLKVTATSSSEKGTMERGNAVMRSTAKKQIRQEIDVSMPLDVNVHVELDTMVKLAHRASKSKMKMVVQRLVRTLRVLTVVAAVNLPIYMMLLFKDWIDK